MTHSIRPASNFVLRLWREPGAPEGDAGWRGLIRPLGKETASSDIPFDGLQNLLTALRQSLQSVALLHPGPDVPPETAGAHPDRERRR